MTFTAGPQNQPMTKPNRRASLGDTTAMLGLSAGAIGWSSLAEAAREETGLPMMLSPKHHRLLENGAVVLKLETGETLSLTSDQYLILQDGLLLITDTLAQASMISLPAMASVRAPLLPDLLPIATIDGTVAAATPAQALLITNGQAPRLSEQVEFQSYEVAQSAETTIDENDGVLPLDHWGAGSMLLMAMLNSGGSSEDDDALGDDATPARPNAAPVIEEAGSISPLPGSISPSSNFDTSGQFFNANGVELTRSSPLILPYASATDADGDALVWTITVVRSSDYTGYDDLYNSPSELLAAFDIYWNDAGSAYLIWSDELETWMFGSSSSAAIESDTWTWDITVSDGNGLTDSVSIDLAFPAEDTE